MQDAQEAVECPHAAHPHSEVDLPKAIYTQTAGRLLFQPRNLYTIRIRIYYYY